MLRSFCSRIVEFYFSSEVWLPNWLVVWASRRADEGAMGRGLDAWRAKEFPPALPALPDPFIRPVSVHWWVGSHRGEAVLSPGRTKKSVYVRFRTPIEVPYPEPGYSYQSTGEEFDLDTGRRVVWGQGNEYLAQDWVLDAADRADILASGGG